MIEKVILSNLIYNEEYGRKVVPFLKPEYFSDRIDRAIYTAIDEYVQKYNGFPTKEALVIDLSSSSLGLSDSQYKEAREKVESLVSENSKLDWLLDESEKFCKEKAVYNAIMESIQIIDDKTGKVSPGSIPKILSDALGVSFDTHIGHDFLEQSDARFEFYRRKLNRVPFDLEYFNQITGGGLPNKTLNVALAGTGVGKSLFMCHCAAGNLSKGKRVLYITLEMAEEEIAKRIDANLLDVTMDELSLLPKEVYDKRVAKVKDKTAGRLIIKEYPTASAGSSNFRHLLNELKIKKNFEPDIIYIDYLNICMSSRLKFNANVNSYTYVKAIAEELRGLAVEFNVPIVSATQTTRSGYSSSDVELTDTSESFGLPATADFMFALVSHEKLQALNQLMVKQLKNRYSDLSHNRRFIIGIDRAKMRLYDVEQSAQEDLLDGPVFDSTSFGSGENDRAKKGKKFDKSKFEGFK
jgi:replicative DNA helicase